MAFVDAEFMKEIDQKYKDIVNGYYKSIRSAIDDSNAYYNPPPQAIYLTLAYYHEREYFSITGKNITISEDKQSALMKAGCWCTVYGAVNVNPMKYPHAIYKWSITIFRSVPGLTLAVGIASDRTRLDDSFHGMTVRAGYQFYAINEYGKFRPEGIAKQNFRSLEPGDTIIMTLDIKARTMTFHKKPGDEVCVVKNVDMEKTYCLAVSLSGSTCRATINSFECL